MLKSAANRVMWVGRVTVFLIGLATVLVLLFWAASLVLWAGGAPSVLGELGRADGSPRPSASNAGDERSLAVEPVARRRAPQGYAHVNVGGTNSTFDPTRSKGVNDVVTVEGFDSRYCFDLTFKPKVAVGSPFINNNATVATATPPDNFGSLGCPEGYRDAAVRTFAANTSDEVPVSFKIMFR
jgi:membrane protein implicated in regulation of membrane protease activity